MTAQTWPSWLELEAEVKSQTTSRHTEELAIIENLLDVFWAGFVGMSSFADPGQGSRLDVAWMLLAVRSFDSLACAYDLLQRGYYGQAMALARSIDEDWLTSKDCAKSAETLAALLDDAENQQQRMPSYADMARRLDAPYNKKWWDSTYGWNSRFAHARCLALRQLLHPAMIGARVGSYYDSDAFLISCYLLVTSAIRVAQVLKQLLQRTIPPVRKTWLKDLVLVLQRAETWLRSVEHKLWGFPEI